MSQVEVDINGCVTGACHTPTLSPKRPTTAGQTGMGGDIRVGLTPTDAAAREGLALKGGDRVAV